MVRSAPHYGPRQVEFPRWLTARVTHILVFGHREDAEWPEPAYHALCGRFHKSKRGPA